MANVTFIDLDRMNTLSNPVTANLSLQESGTSATRATTEEVIGSINPQSRDESSQQVPLPIPTQQEQQREDEDNEDED